MDTFGQRLTTLESQGYEISPPQKGERMQKPKTKPWRLGAGPWKGTAQ
jgi:hypothetical protein